MQNYTFSSKFTLLQITGYSAVILFSNRLCYTDQFHSPNVHTYLLPTNPLGPLTPGSPVSPFTPELRYGVT